MSLPASRFARRMLLATTTNKLYVQRVSSFSYWTQPSFSQSSLAGKTHNDNAAITQRRHFAVRRRRARNRGGTAAAALDGEAETDATRGNVLKPVPITEHNTFINEAEALLSKLKLALEPMQQHNDVFHIFHVTRDEATALNNTFLEEDDQSTNWGLRLVLKPEDGTYILRVDESQSSVNLTSPISGSLTYVLCADTMEWRGEQDGHTLEGLLVRDLIRQCNGYPSL